MPSQTPTPKVVPLLLPQAGNSMEEGTILKWMVAVGDRIKPGVVLYELETDKATIEVEAEETGRLARIVLQDGQTAAVKTPVAYLAESDADLDEFLKGQTLINGHSEAAPTPAPVQMPLTLGELTVPSAQVGASRVKASPVARKAAEERGISLESLFPGSGPDGRILLEDVERAAARAPQQMSVPAPISAPVAPVSAPKPVPAAAGGERKPMDKMRKAIAKNLTVSKQTVPHWYASITIDAEPMLAFYKTEKALYACSLNDVLVYACGRVIQEMPQFRSQVSGDDVVEFPTVNIGLAVALETGLVVPVVKGVDSKNLKGVAAESRRVIDAAKDGKLEGIGEGVFTISNLGMFGVQEFAAIINPPESAILAVGAVREEVVVKDGAMRPGKKMTVTLSADHRIIDGVTSARFLARLKELLESPGLLSAG
jgi:pyruvate dehydrogenase E2 component (dihydrolipoamide acetyltransferase)